MTKQGRENVTIPRGNMPKYTPTPLTTTLSNSSANTINNNLTAIAYALEKTLSRDGTQPNQMTADLDLNHQDVINVANLDADLVSTQELYIDGKKVTPLSEVAGLGDAAFKNTGTTAGTVAAGDDSRFSLAESALQPDDLSETFEVSKSPKAYSVDGSGIPGVRIPQVGVIFRQTDALQENAGAFRVERVANYSGGTFGYENTALLARTIVSEGADSFEDAMLGILDNYSDSDSQNCAGRFQINKFASGSSWSLANEAIDWTGVGDPVKHLIGIEQAMRVNGTDANKQRIGVDAILSRPIVAGAYDGSAAQGSSAFRATMSYDDPAANNWRAAFSAVSSGASSFGDGMDLSGATITGMAIRLQTGQQISLNEDGDRTIRYDFDAIRFSNGIVDHWTLDDFGSTDQFGVIKINGEQVVTSRRTGWFSDTGVAKRTANSTYSGTAEVAYTKATIQTLMDAVRDMSQTIKALKDDLSSHGLIGG